MSSNCNLVSNIYKSRKVLLEMLSDQGYDISEYDLSSMNEVNTMIHNSQLDMFLTKIEPNPDTGIHKKVYICYHLGKNFAGKGISKANLNNLITDDGIIYNDDKLSKNDDLIIITNGDINETITNELNMIYLNKGIFIIIQNLKRLLFNILKHNIVPNHRVITKLELEDVKKQYNILNVSQLPEISRYDPVSQCIGIRPGDVCEIIRPSKTSITTKYYRVCV
jgi:DNA-directed RNA polymerase subunit H (RpoH/RPB5)